MLSTADPAARILKKTETRDNIEWFSKKLGRAGTDAIIETNVVCYGAKKGSCLRLPKHRGGKEHGVKIFRTLVDEIRPRAIIVHGKEVCKELSRALELRYPLPDPPRTKELFVQDEISNGSHVFVIPTLGLPGFRNWPKENPSCAIGQTIILTRSPAELREHVLAETKCSVPRLVAHFPPLPPSDPSHSKPRSLPIDSCAGVGSHAPHYVVQLGGLEPLATGNRV